MQDFQADVSHGPDVVSVVLLILLGCFVGLVLAGTFITQAML